MGNVHILFTAIEMVAKKNLLRRRAEVVCMSAHRDMLVICLWYARDKFWLFAWVHAQVEINTFLTFCQCESISFHIQNFPKFYLIQCKKWWSKSLILGCADEFILESIGDGLLMTSNTFIHTNCQQITLLNYLPVSNGIIGVSIVVFVLLLYRF